jgi:methionine biosynthesis protein MetW
VGFPNFAYLKARLDIFFKGRTPVTPALPYYWYDTPNLHFLTIKDFEDYCRKKRVNVIEEHYLGRKGEIRVLPNLFALNAVFVLSK